MLFTLVAGMLTVRFWGIESVGYIYKAVLLFLPSCDMCSRCIIQKSLPVARCFKGALDKGHFLHVCIDIKYLVCTVSQE